MPKAKVRSTRCGQDFVDAYIDLYQAWEKPQRDAECRSRKTALSTPKTNRLSA